MLGATAYASFVAVPVVPFQSSPSFYAGCNKRTGGAVKDAATFQSSPSFYAGCNLRDLYDSYAKIVSILTQLLCWVQPTIDLLRIPVHECFNPHPAFMLGATNLVHLYPI